MAALAALLVSDSAPKLLVGSGADKTHLLVVMTVRAWLVRWL